MVLPLRHMPQTSATAKRQYMRATLFDDREAMISATLLRAAPGAPCYGDVKSVREVLQTEVLKRRRRRGYVTRDVRRYHETWRDDITPC